MQTPPAGWLECDGAAINRTTYTDLFASIATTYGTGDGSTTFNLPDLRGEFLRGWDNGRGVDSGRVFGSAQLDQFQAHHHSLTYPNTGIIGVDNDVALTTNTTDSQRGEATDPIDDGVNGTPRAGSETRSRNVAMLFCIKF